MSNLSKIELKKRLANMGIKVEGNYIKKSDLNKILSAKRTNAKSSPLFQCIDTLTQIGNIIKNNNQSSTKKSWTVFFDDIHGKGHEYNTYYSAEEANRVMDKLENDSEILDIWFEENYDDEKQSIFLENSRDINELSRQLNSFNKDLIVFKKHFDKSIQNIWTECTGTEKNELKKVLELLAKLTGLPVQYPSE